MYLISLESCNPMLHPCVAFSALSAPPAFWDNPSMPRRSKHSRTAQQQCKNTHAQAFGALPAHAPTLPSPEGSDIYVLDSESEASTIYVDSSDDKESDDEVETVEGSVEALQHLYSVFLPPHLRLEAKTRDKHGKISRRPPINTGESQTTAWRRNAAQRNVAKGCASLNGFVVRKVSS